VKALNLTTSLMMANGATDLIGQTKLTTCASVADICHGHQRLWRSGAQGWGGFQESARATLEV
jgi:hypothetical protein